MAAEEAEIDLEDEVVRFSGREVPFEIDPDLRHRLLNGLDDIGITLQSAEVLERYEAERERVGPVDDRAVSNAVTALPGATGTPPATTGSPVPNTPGRWRSWSGLRPPATRRSSTPAAGADG